jgi:uncharacterized protein YjbJ (UPF0337 family)
MKDSSKHRIKAKVLKVKGAVKEAVGKATNDTELEDDGVADRIAGKVVGGIAAVEDAAGQ